MYVYCAEGRGRSGKDDISSIWLAPVACASWKVSRARPEFITSHHFPHLHPFFSCPTVIIKQHVFTSATRTRHPTLPLSKTFSIDRVVSSLPYASAIPNLGHRPRTRTSHKHTFIIHSQTLNTPRDRRDSGCLLNLILPSCTSNVGLLSLVRLGDRESRAYK